MHLSLMFYVSNSIHGMVLLQVAFCAGPLVQTLLQSNAHNYCEFKLLQGRCVPAMLSTKCQPVVIWR